MALQDKRWIEAWAAAYAAEALSATPDPRDENTGVSMRDFDLIFADGHYEPLEVTVHAETAILHTQARVKERPRHLAADVSRVWVCTHGYFQVDASGAKVAFDLRACERRLPQIVERLERAGASELDPDLMRWGGQFQNEALQLIDLGIHRAISVTPSGAENQPGIQLLLMYGAAVNASFVTAAVEAEASDPGNQKKLAVCLDAPRRHLFVVLTHDDLWALNHILERQMRLPLLPSVPDAITTVWAGGLNGAIFVTPPNPWQIFTPTRELRERYATVG